MGYNLKQNSDGSTSLENFASGKEVLKLDANDNLILNASTSVGSSARVKSTLFDDFDQNAIDTFRWNLVAGSDAQAVVAVINAQAGGFARAVMGDDAAGSMAVNGSGINNQLCWFANKGGLIFEARLNLSAITNISVFVGLTDTLALEAPVTSAASANTITTNATDAVGFMFDTSMTDDNWWLVGVDNGTDATHQDVGSAPVADTNQIFRIEVNTSGGATFFIDGSQVGTAMTDAVKADVALTPFIGGFTRTAASANIDVDYIFAQQDR